MQFLLELVLLVPARLLLPDAPPSRHSSFQMLLLPDAPLLQLGWYHKKKCKKAVNCRKLVWSRKTSSQAGGSSHPTCWFLQVVSQAWTWTWILQLSSPLPPRYPLQSGVFSQLQSLSGPKSTSSERIWLLTADTSLMVCMGQRSSLYISTARPVPKFTPGRSSLLMDIPAYSSISSSPWGWFLATFQLSHGHQQT